MQEGWAVDWDSGYLTETAWKNHMALAERTQTLGKFAIWSRKATKVPLSASNLPTLRIC
ncbi:MAG: hypothetical protein ACP5QU_05205 [Anaerolineae bacterium]